VKFARIVRERFGPVKEKPGGTGRIAPSAISDVGLFVLQSEIRNPKSEIVQGAGSG
jgi:hypothetical protein